MITPPSSLFNNFCGHWTSSKCETLSLSLYVYHKYIHCQSIKLYNYSYCSSRDLSPQHIHHYLHVYIKAWIIEHECIHCTHSCMKRDVLLQIMLALRQTCKVNSIPRKSRITATQVRTNDMLVQFPFTLLQSLSESISHSISCQ